MSRIRAIYDIQYSRDLEKKLFAMGLDFTKQNTTEVYEVNLKFLSLSNVIHLPVVYPCYDIRWNSFEVWL